MSFPRAGLATIRRTMREPIFYTGAGVADTPLDAIPSETAAPAFNGPGSTVRMVTFEIAFGALPQRPKKGNLIVHASGRWSVLEILDDSSISAWILTVEKAP